ncbi:MAG: hypothetical protein AAFY08_07745 [Planctomycetota bacterium]
MSVDFLPESYRQKRQLRHLKRVCGVIAVCLTAVALTWGGMQMTVAGRMATRADALAAQARTAQQTHDELARVTEEHRVLKRQAEIGRELAMPFDHADLMHLFAEALPAEVGLTQLDVTTVRPKPQPAIAPGATPAPRNAKPAPAVQQPDRLEVQLTGIAPSDLVVAELVNALTTHPAFDAVTLHGSRPVERFGYHVRLFDLSLQAPLNRRFIRLDTDPRVLADAEQPTPDAQSAVEVTP